MKKTFLFAIVVIASLASCTKESTDKVQTSRIAGQSASLSLSATVPTLDDTKTFYHFTGSIYWNASDALSVFNDSNTLGGVFDINAGNTATGEFTCESWAGGVPTMAIFCFDLKGEPYKTAYSDGKYTAQVLATQKGNNPNSFSAYSNTAIGKITGNATDGYSVEMKNVLGLVRVDFTSLIDKEAKKSTMKSVALEDAKGEAYIAGDILVGYNDGTPTCELVEGTGEKVVTRVNSTASSSLAVSSTGCVYFNVLPGVSFVPKFTFTDMNGQQAVIIANGPIQAERSKYFPCGEPKISWGKQKETAVFDFTSWCVKETLVKTANKTTTYTLGTETEFLSGAATIKVTTGSKTCNWTDTQKDLRFYKQDNDGDAYPKIEIPVREGYKLAKVSISTDSSAGKYFTLKDLSGEVLQKTRLSTGTTATMTVDVENTTGADGCVFHLADNKSQYQVSRISVTYVKPLE